MPTDELTVSLRDFAGKRSWTKLRTPRNLMLALVGEVGEAATPIRWGSGSEVAGDSGT